MVKVESFEGDEKETDCIGCDLLKAKAEKVGETKNFVVRQDYETPIPGFMIISSKKHIKGIEDLSEDERKEFIELLFRVRKAMTDALGIKYVYIAQKEDSIINRSHFHIWLFPRYGWMEEYGRKIASITHIVDYARKNMKTDENIAKVKQAAEKIKGKL